MLDTAVSHIISVRVELRIVSGHSGDTPVMAGSGGSNRRTCEGAANRVSHSPRDTPPSMPRTPERGAGREGPPNRRQDGNCTGRDEVEHEHHGDATERVQTGVATPRRHASWLG
jgi:hypothetical protein